MSQTSKNTAGVSRVSIKRRIALLAILFVVAGSLSYPGPANWLIDQTNSALRTNFSHINKPFILGLDLQGGTRLEYEADVSRLDPSKQAAALDGVKDVIERRVNSMGVSEPLVQVTRSGDDWRVAAELAGVKDINQAIKMIGETPILEFKEINEDPARELTDEERALLEESEKTARIKAEAFLAEAKQQPEKFQDMVRESSENIPLKEQGGDFGFIKDNVLYAEVYAEAVNVQPGTVLDKVFSLPMGEVVVKVEEKKESGQEVKARHILIQFAGASQASADITRTKEQALEEIKRIKEETTGADFTDLAKKYSEEPGAGESGGDLGWFDKGVMVEEFENAVYAMSKGEVSEPVETAFGYHLIYKEDERSVEDARVSVAIFNKTQESDILPPQDDWKGTDLTGKQLASAILDFDPNSGSPLVSLQFDDEGAELFADITKRNVGKPVAIFLDGEPISVPTVQSEILGGKAVITGTFTVNEAKVLAQRLQAGALPVPITLIAQQSVGPMLGADSIKASMVAGMWGLILVSIFMLLVYRLPGLISVVALVVYGALSFAIFKSLPVTLTLSGIAGFILSVGMAVDANVLIFERLKEELKSGKSYTLAMEEAFRRAWPSIRDGNLTTIIACVALYWFTSSVIKGFALTLGIGVIISMFSAIVVTRNLMRFIITPSLASKIGWLLLKPQQDKDNNK